MSPKLPIITPKQLISALLKAGFIIHHQKGSHVTLKQTGSPNRRVVVAIHNKDLKKGTLSSILKDADLTIDEINELL